MKRLQSFPNHIVGFTNGTHQVLHAFEVAMAHSREDIVSLRHAWHVVSSLARHGLLECRSAARCCAERSKFKFKFKLQLGLRVSAAVVTQGSSTGWFQKLC